MKMNNTRICRLCGSEKTLTAFQVDEYQIVRCGRCGLLYNSKPLDNHRAADFYNRDYFVNADFYRPGRYYGYPDYPRDRSRLLKTFDRRLDTIETLSRRGSLLDIGSALGFFLEAAADRGWRCTGCDISTYAVNFAAQKGHNVNLGDISAVRETGFDVITMFDLLEHVADPLSQLDSAFRRLRENGLLVLTFPDVDSLPARIMKGYWPEIKRVREHNFFFSTAIVRSMLEKIGFDVIKKEHAGKVVVLDSLLSEIGIYNRYLYRALRGLADVLGLTDREFFFIPLYKTTLYARRRASASN